MNKTKDAFYRIRLSYPGSGLVTAGSSPGENKKARRIRRSSATRKDRSRRPTSPIEPNTTSAERNRPFLLSVGNFWCKTDRLYRYPRKGRNFLYSPSPMSTEEVFCYMRVLSYRYIRHRYTVAHRLTALYTFSVRDLSWIGRIL